VCNHTHTHIGTVLTVTGVLGPGSLELCLGFVFLHLLTASTSLVSRSSFYRAMHVVLARYCYCKFTKLSVCLPVCLSDYLSVMLMYADVSWAYMLG